MFYTIHFHGLLANRVSHIHGMQGVINNERLSQKIVDALIVTFGIRQQTINELKQKGEGQRKMLAIYVRHAIDVLSDAYLLGVGQLNKLFG
jgi:hypothetical protein